MKKKVFLKYCMRFFVAVVIQYLVKLFDATYEGKIFLFDLRGTLFFIYFISFTLIIWETGDLIRKYSINSLLNKYDLIKQFTYLTIIISAYGLIVAFLFSLTYYLFDFLLFGFHHYGGHKYQFLDLDAYVGMFFGYLAIILVNSQLQLFTHWKKDRYLTAQLQKESFQAKFEALKNQVDPHFLFNSLSVLTTLVYKNQDLAAEYINQLSKLYRYILEKKEDNMVLLRDEIEHLDSYFFLIKIRFGDQINLTILLSDETRMQGYIPPNTLQMLVENAIKHNRFSDNEPLGIKIYETQKNIVVENNHRERRLLEESSKLGLKNISDRYKLLCDLEIEITEENGLFRIGIPKINREIYESTYF